MLQRKKAKSGRKAEVSSQKFICSIHATLASTATHSEQNRTEELAHTTHISEVLTSTSPKPAPHAAWVLRADLHKLHSCGVVSTLVSSKRKTTSVLQDHLAIWTEVRYVVQRNSFQSSVPIQIKKKNLIQTQPLLTSELWLKNHNQWFKGCCYRQNLRQLIIFLLLLILKSVV